MLQVKHSEDLERVRLMPRRSWETEYDLDALVEFMTANLRTPSGEMILHKHQAVALAELHDYGGLILPWAVGEGKEQPNSEPVLLDRGWVPIGDVRTGDRVYGSDGALHEVLGVYPQGVKDVYEVTFSDGTKTRCGLEHLWTVRDVFRKRRYQRRTLTLKQLMAERLYRESGTPKHKIWRFFVPMPEPVQHPEQDLPLDPYTLGALIGDGGLTHGVYFTNMDLDIVEGFSLPEGVVRRFADQKSRATTWRFVHPGQKRNALKEVLRDLGLFGLKSGAKFVPEVYMRGAVKQRIALLQGLLDTDGEWLGCSPGFSTVSPTLAHQIQELVESLGGSATIIERAKPYHFRVSCRLPWHIPPFRCARQLAKWKTAARQRPPGRSIRSIELVGREESTCIQVSAPDSLYMTRHHILTHNTICSLLAAAVVQAKRPLLLVPGGLVDKTTRDAIALSKHWLIPPFNLQSYQKLSLDYDNAYLTDKLPDLIVCDEAHILCNTANACWKRLRAYIRYARGKGYPLRLVMMSGTLTNRSLADHWHIQRAVFGDHAPVPRQWDVMKEWAVAMGSKIPPGVERPHPGPLVTLGEHDPHADPLTQARQAFGDRMSATPGVVFVAADRPPQSLEIHAKFLDLPSSLDEHFAKLREEWLTPDDHPFEYSFDLWRHARELACGFYGRWVPRPPDEWRAAWTAWRTYSTEVLKYSRTYHSPGQLKDAIRRGLEDDGGVLDYWEQTNAEYEYETEAVWVDDTVLRYAAEWLHKHKGLCWVEHVPFGQRLSELTGVPFFREKGYSQDGIFIEDHRGPAICGESCATGLNLQYKWHRNLIVSAEPTGKYHEQLIGRTHRFGQPRDCVYVDYLFACKEQLSGFWQAVEDSRRNADERMTPNAKLIYATLDVPMFPPHHGAAWK